MKRALKRIAALTFVLCLMLAAFAGASLDYHKFNIGKPACTIAKSLSGLSSAHADTPIILDPEWCMQNPYACEVQRCCRGHVCNCDCWNPWNTGYWYCWFNCTNCCSSYQGPCNT